MIGYLGNKQEFSMISFLFFVFRKPPCFKANTNYFKVGSNESIYEKRLSELTIDLLECD